MQTLLSYHVHSLLASGAVQDADVDLQEQCLAPGFVPRFRYCSLLANPNGNACAKPKFAKSF